MASLIRIFTFEGVTVGLRKNGSVAVTGSRKNNEGYNIQSWRDIIDIYSGDDWTSYETVGIKTDGTVVSVCGENSYGKCDIAEWSDIIDTFVPMQNNALQKLLMISWFPKSWTLKSFDSAFALHRDKATFLGSNDLSRC